MDTGSNLRLPLGLVNSLDVENNSTKLGAHSLHSKPTSGSRIPKAQADTPRSTTSNASNSRIPRLGAMAVEQQVSSPASSPTRPKAIRGIPSGFQAYTNPSFEGTQSDQGEDSPRSVARDSPTKSPSRLLTPEALNILHQINRKTPCPENQGMRNIMNAFLRTGPEKLSPEPSSEYFISVPRPAAVMAPGIINFNGTNSEGVYGAIHGYLRTGAHMLSPEPGYANGVTVPLLPNLAVLHPRAAYASRLPAPPVQQQQKQQQRQQPEEPIYVPAEIIASPEPEPSSSRTAYDEEPVEVTVAPVESPQPETTPSDNPEFDPMSVCGSNVLSKWQRREETTDEEEEQQKQDPTTRQSIAPSPFMETTAAAAVEQVAAEKHQQASKLESHRPAQLVVSCEPLPVAAPVATTYTPCDLPSVRDFAGSIVPIPVAQPAAKKVYTRKASVVTFDLPPLEDSHDTAAGAAQGSSPSTGSFSFGMGGGAIAGTAAAALANADQLGASDEEDPTAVLPRVSSGETVSQPNPFHKMLQHLQGDNYASPAKFAQHNMFDQHNEEGSSPESPKDLTPLHLVSESGSPSPLALLATPELGKLGSFDRWMHKRFGPQGLASPALRDLAKLWAAANEKSSVTSAADTLRMENEALRRDLEETQRALRGLGEQHEVAVSRADTERQWAQAEASRAQEAAHQMRLLAEQIQAAFTACERENQMLSEQVETARTNLAAIETRAQQGDVLAAELVKARDAAHQAEEEAALARQMAAETAAELEAIRVQLETVQLGGDATPLPKLHSRLHEMHRALNDLQMSSPVDTPEIANLLRESDYQLEAVSRLLSHDMDAMKDHNEELKVELQQAREALAQRSPAAAVSQQRQREVVVAEAEEEQVVAVDYRQFQQAMGIPDSPDSVADEAPSPENSNIVVEGVLVTNVPSKQVNKVKDMVSFFETLGDVGMYAGGNPLPEAAAEPTCTSAVDEQNQQQQQQQQQQDDEYMHQAVVDQQAEDDDSPAARAPVEREASTPESQLVSYNSMPAPVPLNITPLSLEDLKDRSGEEMRREVRARLDRLKSDLQAAQSKLKCVDRDLSAFSTPRSRQNAPAPIIVRITREAAPVQQPVAQQRPMTPVVSHRIESIEGSAVTSTAADPQEETMNGGILRPANGPATVQSKRRMSVTFAPSVKGEDADSESEMSSHISREHSQHPLTPGLTLTGSNEPVVATSTTPVDAAHQQRRQQPIDAASVHQARAAAAFVQEEQTNGVGEGVGSVARAPARAMHFDSDDSEEEEEDDRLKTDVCSRYAYAEYGYNSHRTPAHRTHQSHFRSSTPSIAQSLFSSGSSFAAPEPMALLNMRPIVSGRTRRGPGHNTTGRKPSASEEKEFRRRAAALKIHVSPYFSRKEGPSGRRDGGVL